MNILDVILLASLVLATGAVVVLGLQGRRDRNDLERAQADIERLRGAKDEHLALQARTETELANTRDRLLDAQDHADRMQDLCDRTRTALDELRVDHAAVLARVQHAEDNQAAMKEAFKLASTDGVREALADLAKRNDETHAQREALAREKLNLQLKPVAETLDRFEKQVALMEQSRAADQGGLKAQIEALMKASADTQTEARRLSAALRRGAGVQGRWGEQTLRNVLEHAGLHNRFDFSEQVSVDNGEGRRRPDVTVRMPGGGVFVIDAKCSLTAFLEAQEATEDAARLAGLSRHAASLRAHMTGLSAREYWDQFKALGSPDFVAMFVPGDGFLSAALDHAPELLSEAMEKRVIIVTPTTLFALCKAVAYGWRVEEQSKNADDVAKLGKELYRRISVMGGHAGGVGRALASAVSKYNDFVGSLESQVLTQARRFEELKVDHEAKDIPELLHVDAAIRPLMKLAAPEAPVPFLSASGG